MSILLRVAEIWGAAELLDIAGAHIDSTIYIGPAGLEFAERLAALGAKVAVPTTLNVGGLDEHHWQEWPVPADWAAHSHRQMVAYQGMGAVPTWTCAPYQTAWKPAFGQQVAWGESNAIVFANSVIGARTERYPDLLDICCAITGRAPAVGLHLTENRAGQVLFRLVDVPLALQQDDSFYPVLGHLVGKVAQDRVAVIDGLAVQPAEDQLKALGAAAASSGAVALFHIVGVTPEAPTLAAALQDRPPQQVVDVTPAALCTARQELTTATGDRLDMVVLGSPHFSLAEFRQLAPLLAERQVHPAVQFLVTSSRAVAMLARQAGYLTTLEQFGGKVTVDTCILASPMLPAGVERLMTNSAKYAYYAPGLLGTQITFGSLQDCVRSAVGGRVIRDEALWESASSPDPGAPQGGLPAPTWPTKLAGEEDWISEEAPLPPDAGGTTGVPYDLQGNPQITPALGGRGTALNGVLGTTVRGRVVISGNAKGIALVSDEPLSFWGGYDYRTGEIIDRRHPLAGQLAAGRILCLPFTRGSSTTTAVLLEAIRAGTAPAAILTTGVDTFFALAVIVADELFGRPLPLVALAPTDFGSLRTGDRLTVSEDGAVIQN